MVCAGTQFRVEAVESRAAAGARRQQAPEGAPYTHNQIVFFGVYIHAQYPPMPQDHQMLPILLILPILPLLMLAC